MDVQKETKEKDIQTERADDYQAMLHTMNNIDRKDKKKIELSERIASKYSKELDKVVRELSAIIARPDIDNLDENTLEHYCLQIPTLLYYVSAKTEDIGAHMDSVKTERNRVFNKTYMETPGTGTEKKIAAEKSVENHESAINVYKRATNILQKKSEAASKLYDAVKKVLTKRIAEHDLHRKSG